MDSRVLRGYGFSLTTALCWGITAVLAKWGVTHLAPPLAGATIALLSGTILLTLAGGWKQSDNSLKGKKGTVFFALGGMTAAAGVIGQYYALSFSPVTIVSPFVNSSPLLVLILVRLFLGRLERITPRLVAGALLIVAGGILIVLTKPS